MLRSGKKVSGEGKLGIGSEEWGDYSAWYDAITAKTIPQKIKQTPTVRDTLEWSSKLRARFTELKNKVFTPEVYGSKGDTPVELYGKMKIAFGEYKKAKFEFDIKRERVAGLTDDTAKITRKQAREELENQRKTMDYRLQDY